MSSARLYGKAKKKLADLSIAASFFTLLSLTFLISLLISATFVLPRVEESIFRSQEATSRTEVELTAKYLEQFLNDRIAVLKEVADYPIVKNAVMGSGIDSDNIDDFMELISVLGKKEDMALLTIEAEPVYERNSKHMHKYEETAAWFKNILEGRSTLELNLKRVDQSQYFQVAVPISLHGLVEGVLVSEIEADLEEIFDSLFTDYHRALSLSKSGVVLSGFQELSNEGPVTFYHTIDSLGVELQYYLDSKALEEKKNTVLYNIAISIFLSLLLSYLVLITSGKIVLLAPYKKLEKSEANLKHTEEKLLLALNDLKMQKFALDQHSIVTVTDASGTITYANQRFSDVSGYRQDELIGQNHRLLKSGYHDESFYKDIYASITNGKVWSGLICNRRKNGELYWVDSTLIPYLNEAGKPQSYIAIRADVTEKVHKQEALYESEAFQELVLQNIPDYMYVKNRKGHLVQANQKFLDLYPEGSRDKIIGTDAMVHLGDADRAVLFLEDEKAFGKGYFEVQRPVHLPDGTWRIWLVKNIRFKNTKGEYFILVLARDIADQVAQEHALKESEKRFQLAVAGSNDGLWDWDIATDEVYYAPRFRELLGYDGSDLDHFPNVFCSWEAHLHPEDMDTVFCAIEAHLSNNDPFDVEFRLRTKDEAYGFFQAKGKAVRDQDGIPTRMSGALTDISHFKKQQLELIEARTSAELANHAKSDFLASMSHEIRTPMNGILGMLRMLLKSKLNDAQRRQLEIAKTSADSLLHIINEILDFSKVDAGKMQLERLEFNLRDFLSKFVEGMALRAQELGLEFILDLSQLPPVNVIGDSGRIRQILNNLVANAFKFTAEGEVVVSAQLDFSEDNQALFHCTVKDSGIGISAKNQITLFDAFTQADSSTTRKYGGTGLGLTICMRFCELMGGSIIVESQSGQGSAFTFNIPLLVAESNRFQANSKGILKDSSISRLIGKKALVVDDNATVLAALMAQLSAWGVRTFAASEGLEAFHLLSTCEESQPFDTLLIDRDMSGLNGLQCIEKIRGDQRFKALHIVLMVPLNLNIEPDQIREWQIQSLLTKPVIPQDLAAIFNWSDEVSDEIGQNSNRKLDGPDTLELTGASDEDDESRHNAFAPEHFRVLLVEDNAINQEVAKGILEELQLTSDVAGNGLEAIRALEAMATENPYNLVLMDCQMPEMDGYEATKAIRNGQAGETMKTIKIVAMTANAMEGDKEKCLAMGMNDYISKPIELEALKRVFSVSPSQMSNQMSSQSRQTATFEGAEASIADQAREEKLQKLEARIRQYPVWDEAGALKRCRKSERLIKIVESYLNRGNEDIEKLMEACQLKDSVAIQTIAHGIRGVSANLEAQRLAARLEFLEHYAKANEDFATLEDMVDQITADFELLSTVLQRYLGQ